MSYDKPAIGIVDLWKFKLMKFCYEIQLLFLLSVCLPQQRDTNMWPGRTKSRVG